MLSVHTGSDRFSLYPLMRGAMRRCDAGLHLKTAGTTWLEEVIGLTEAAAWSAEAFAVALHNDLSYPRFNPEFRQRVHVGYKIASEMGEDSTRLLRRHALRAGENVTHNIYRRHNGPLCAGTDGPDWEWDDNLSTMIFSSKPRRRKSSITVTPRPCP